MSQTTPQTNRRIKIIPPLTILRPIDETASPPWQRNLIYITFGALLSLNQFGLHQLPGTAVWTNAGLLLLLAVACLKLPTARSALAGMLVITTANCIAVVAPNQLLGQAIYLCSLAGLGLVYLQLRQLHYRALQPTVWEQALAIGLLVGGGGYLISNSYLTTPAQSLLLFSPLSALASEVILRGLIQARGQIYTNPKLAAAVSISLGVSLTGQFSMAGISQAVLFQAGAAWLYWRHRYLNLTIAYSLITQLACASLLLLKH